jgi:LPXTG-motif cell wall-anchored protein
MCAHYLSRPLCRNEQTGVKGAVYNASTMDTNTLIIIILVVLLLGGGGFFYRGRR